MKMFSTMVPNLKLRAANLVITKQLPHLCCGFISTV